MNDLWTEEDDELLAAESATFDATMDRLRLAVRISLIRCKQAFLKGWNQREHP